MGLNEDQGFAYFCATVGVVIIVNFVSAFTTGEIYSFNVNAGGRFGGSGEGDLIVEYSRSDGGRGFWGTVGFQLIVVTGCVGYIVTYLRGKKR